MYPASFHGTSIKAGKPTRKREKKQLFSSYKTAAGVLYRFPTIAVIPMDHRMVWVRKDLKDHPVPTPPATDRDTFH